MNHTYDIVALGDVNLDYIVTSSLPFAFASLRENGVIYWEAIDEVPGGSGLNFCIFAQEAGYQTLLLSKIGKDTAGDVITKWLEKKNVALSVTSKTSHPTGKALIMRDSAGIRLLINNKINANHFLDEVDIDANKEAIKACRILYISGYSISELDKPRYQATLQGMDFAKSNSVSPVIVFDVVPHRIYEKLDFEQFRECTKHVDILISEVATVRRFLGLGSKSELIDDNIARDTAYLMTEYYEKLMLRYGPSGCDKQILIDKQCGDFSLEETYHNQQNDKRGFGDKLAIKALRDFFKVL